MSIEQYTIGAVKTIRGHDGDGFSCNLMKNKKKVAEVVDDGWGGGYQFHWVDHKTSALVHSRTYDDKPHSFEGTVEEAMFYAEIMKLPKIPADDDLPEMFTSPDIFVGEIVNKILLEKDIVKDFKKSVTIKCDDGKILTWKVSKTHDLGSLKTYAKTKHPNAIILNDVSVSDVIKIYKEANLI